MTNEFLAAYAKHGAELAAVLTKISEAANPGAREDAIAAGDPPDSPEAYAAVFAPYVIGYHMELIQDDHDAPFAIKMLLGGMIDGAKHRKERKQ